MQYFKFFSYYLNTRRLADLSGITIPTAAQDGLVRNSGARREAMEAAKAIAQRLLHSGSIPSLATLISQRELKGERILASLWIVLRSGAFRTLCHQMKLARKFQTRASQAKCLLVVMTIVLPER